VGLDAKALVDAFAAVQKLVPLPAIFFSADAGKSMRMLHCQQAARLLIISYTTLTHSMPKILLSCVMLEPVTRSRCLADYVRAPSAAAGRLQMATEAG
jgi:hypothetical protein